MVFFILLCILLYVGGGPQVLVQYDGECCRQAHVEPVGWEGAVCATNGRTYHDTAVISLMRKFGQCKNQTFIYELNIKSLPSHGLIRV